MARGEGMIEKSYDRLKELVKGDNKIFRKSLDEMMNLDPWPGNLEEFVMFTNILDQQAQLRGFNTWIQAYHEFEVEEEEKENPNELIEEEDVFLEKKLKVNKEEQKLGVRSYSITKEGRFRCDFCQELDMVHTEYCLVGRMLKGMNL